MDLIKIHHAETDDFIGYAESRKGGRIENQDSFSFDKTRWGLLVAVCDGMGGGPSGKKASTIAVTEIIRTIQRQEKDDTSILEIVKTAVEQANASIYDLAEKTPELKGMGSTATVLLLNEQSAIIAHVGDSRVYQLRGHQKIFRTFDHSVVFDLVKQGIITEEQARLSAHSNVITRALGVREKVDVDVCEVPYVRGDRFLLCSDGIHGCMKESELIKLATDRRNALGPTTDNIATTADDIGRINGGEYDNLTVILLQANINSKLETPMSKKTRIFLLTMLGLLLLSVLLNMIQCINSMTADDKTVNAAMLTDTTSKKRISELEDSIAKLNESINKQLQDSIKNQTK